MSERKYRQRGYRDDDREHTTRDRPNKPKGDGKPRSVINREHRTPNMPGFHDVVRCARCGQTLNLAIGPESRCSACGSDLYACALCASFDSGSRFECQQPIKARVAPKDVRNACDYFEPRVTVERQTHSARVAPTGTSSARQAFDDLFK